jgi:hypothetical protein
MKKYVECYDVDNKCKGETTEKIVYSGPNLPCIGVSTCENLTTVIQKIDSKVCESIADVLKYAQAAIIARDIAVAASNQAVESAELASESENLAQEYATNSSESLSSIQDIEINIIDLANQLLVERRSDFVTDTSYMGKAPQGSLESSPVWTITKIVVDIDGTTTVTTASNVAWTDRLTVIYS